MFDFFRNPRRLFTPGADYNRGEPGHTVVVGAVHSPTMAFYFRSRQAGFDHYLEVDSSLADAKASEPLLKALTPGCRVILVRDVPLSVLRVLANESRLFSSVVWFMDDDFPGAHSDHSLPKAYRKRLATWYRRASPLLAQLCDSVWVSTSHLAKKYNLPESAVLPPVEPVGTVSQPLMRCFYHGSSSHTQEWAFVREVVKLVQARNPNTWFELMGDHALYRQFRGIPRISILHPMPWPDYLAMTSSRTMDIGLSPLMDTPFNLARSHTKFLDITRQNAVGIYSERFSHAQEILHGGAGLVLPDDPVVWAEGVESLLTVQRSDMIRNAVQLQSLAFGEKHIRCRSI